MVMNAIVPGVLVELTPLVRRITAPNPGMMTGPGTNTYLIGEGDIAVIGQRGDHTDDFWRRFLDHPKNLSYPQNTRKTRKITPVLCFVSFVPFVDI